MTIRARDSLRGKRRFLGAAVLGALVVLGVIVGSCRRDAPITEEAPPRANVLLLVVDTLRADHLGSYGSTHELTPHLDHFAEEGVTFRSAIAQGSNTITSSASLLASVYPTEHGYTNYAVAVAEPHLTLAELMAHNGYETFAVSTNPHVTARNGLAQGFETFIDHVTWTDTDADEVNGIFLDWLTARQDDRPYFAMLWYVDPHVPYQPPQDLVEKHVPAERLPMVSLRTARPGFKKLSADEKEVTKALYRGEVESWDRDFGELRRELESRGAFDDSLIVFTSDHGESFWEHDGPDGRPVVGHGISLFREETAVPLLMRFPGAERKGAVDRLVDSIDVVPTLQDYLRLEIPDSAELAESARAEPSSGPFRGESLLPWALPPGQPIGPVGQPVSVSELITELKGKETMRLTSVESDEGKLVVIQRYRKKVYDPPLMWLLDRSDGEALLPSGPGTQGAETRALLLEHLRTWRAGLSPIPATRRDVGKDDAELVKRLKALGYLN